MFVERLHPRDRDGKFAHTPGGGGGALQVASRVRNGAAVVERGRVRAAGPSAAPDTGARWSGAGTRHVGVINGREYHLHRTGGSWHIYDGDPAQKRKIGTVGTIADAKAHAHAHAHGRTGPPTPPPTPPPARKATPRARRTPPATPPATPDAPPEPAAPRAVDASRPARVSPTTAAAIRAARTATPSDRDAWHRAASIKTDPKTIARLQARADAADKAFNEHVAKIEARRNEVIAAKLAEWKAPPTDKAARDRAAKLAAIDPQIAALQKQGMPILIAKGRAEGDLWDAQNGAGMPRDPATDLAMPTPALNAHLDRTLAVGRAVLADHKREVERTAAQYPAIGRAREKIAERDRYLATSNAAAEAWNVFNNTAAAEPIRVTLPDGSTTELRTVDDADALDKDMRGKARALRGAADYARRTIARHEQRVLRDMLADQRGFGGVSHETAVAVGKGDISAADAKEWGVVATRADWLKRLQAGEEFFPDAWLEKSAAGQPLRVATSRRAFYDSPTNVISLPGRSRDAADYDGAFDDETAEITVHELGHRMEQHVPGLTALEFAFVRRHATRPDGSVERLQQLPGYANTEQGQKDDWGRPYAGKSYERARVGRGPHESHWEVFQVGLQDTFGRSSQPFGRQDDPEELQAFVIGALLTLG